MSEPPEKGDSQPLSATGISQPLGTTTGRLAAIRLKSANKYIFRALLSLASANLLIRVMGMLNQIVVTARFGQGASMDAYFVAAALPTLLAQLLASALEASVIPVYARVRTKDGRVAASRLFSTLLNILFITMVVVTIFMLVFRQQMVFFSAPSLKASSQELALGLTPYIFPVLIFMVLNSFMECLLNTEGQFGWPAYAGMLVPLTTASFVLVGGKTEGVVMLCLGTLVGQFAQLAVIIVRAHRAHIVYKPIIDWRNPELRAILLVAWPVLFSALISQASPLVDQMFASSLSTGSIAVLNNALKLISVPVGVIFSSVGRAALPYLASQAAMKDMKSFKATLRLYLWAVTIGTLALTAFLILLAHPIVEILFQHGAFSEEDTTRTAITLIGFSIGLAPMAIGFIISRAFSALGKTHVLMYITIFSIGANALFDYVFARIWQSFGIALSTSVVYCCTMVILLVTLRSVIGKLSLFTPPREVLKVIWKIGLGQYYINWVLWKEEYLTTFRLPYGLSRNIIRGTVILSVFIAGIVGSALNSLYTLRVAFGAIIVLAFFRYRYFLLMVWILLNAFIGSNLPFFNGNNFLSGLTLPTLILLFVLPTKDIFKRMPALPFFLAYVAWVFLGIGLSPLTMSQFFTLWLIMLDSIAISVLTVAVVTNRKRMLQVMDAILIPAVFIALYGIYGYFVKKNGVVDTTTSLFRISSIFGNTPPTLALFLSIVLPMSIYRTFTLEGLKRIPGILVVLLLLGTLGLTFDRAALISVPVSIIVMIIFLPSRKLRLSMIGGMIAVGALTVLFILFSNTNFFQRFLNADVTTLNGRTYLWAAIIDHFDPAKLLGNGLKASDALLANLQVGVGRGVIATAAHNIFLETLYDHGMIGLLFLLLTFLAFAISLLRKVRKGTPDYRMLLAMALAIFFNVVVQSFESNDFWNPSVGIYFWILMALPFATYWFTPVSDAQKNMNEQTDTLVEETEQQEKQVALV